MNRLRPRTGVGASSILLIIVVLSLTTFGVLTLVSARADKTLSARTVETTQAYYTADAAAQRKLQEIDGALLSGAAPADIAGLAESEDMPGAYVFQSETGDGRAIRVTVRLNEGGSRFVVTEYRLIHLTDWGKPENFLLASPNE